MIKHKYNAKTTLIDGINFSSAFESRIYKYFKDNNIEILSTQIKFELQPKFRYKGELIRAIGFIPDFLIKYNGKEIYVEAKGMEMPDWKIKKKLFLYKFPDLDYIVVKSLKSLQDQLKNFD